MVKRLLKNGTVVSGKDCVKADLLIEDGRIAAVENGLSCEDAVCTDVEGKLIFPGFIDAHTHFDLEVSDTVTADDFASGTEAAIAGGTTAVIDFATQNRGESLHQALENWHRKADGKASCDYGFHMAISDWNERTAKEMEELFQTGVTSFKLYMTYDNMAVNDGELYEVLKEAGRLGALVGVHCENGLLIKELVKEQKEAGRLGPMAHPLSRPAPIEEEAIQRLAVIAGLAGAPVMVVHLSTKAGYEQIAAARRRGQTVYTETCPQYLLMDDSLYLQQGFEGAKYVISPPLRKREDQECLWKALQNNEIQTVCTDHCSFTLAQKAAGRADFTRIPNGMPGVEDRAALLYTYGVIKKRISLPQMCRLLSENQARLYGMYPRKGCIKPGSDADLVVWDPEYRGTISVKQQHYRTDYAPFEGTEVAGRPFQVYLRGELAAQNGQVLRKLLGEYVKRGSGQL